MNQTISPATKDTINTCLKRRPEILFAILYGSAAEGSNFRDFDIGLFIDRELLPDSADLKYGFALADELEQLLPCPVDVRIINDAPLPFRYNVSRGLPLIVNDAAQYFHFLERTWDEFFDFRPVAMQYLREM